jgi:hypothetical protein
MGATAAGKTTLRKERYSHGYVLIDAADIFTNLSRGEPLAFPEPLEEPMNLLGSYVTHRALSERRNIVTEITGTEHEPTHALICALRRIGYKVQLILVESAVEDALQRQACRPDTDISARDAEPFHRAWLLDACSRLAPNFT